MEDYTTEISASEKDEVLESAGRVQNADSDEEEDCTGMVGTDSEYCSDTDEDKDDEDEDDDKGENQCGDSHVDEDGDNAVEDKDEDDDDDDTHLKEKEGKTKSKQRRKRNLKSEEEGKEDNNDEEQEGKEGSEKKSNRRKKNSVLDSEGDDNGESESDDDEEGKLETKILDYELGSSDDEVPKGPIRSKHEVEVLPPVPLVNIVLKPHHQTRSVGIVSSVLGTSVVVESSECHIPLNEGTILWLTDKRLPLGMIDELFGPVKNPYYLVRFNTVDDVPEFVKEGVHVSYVPEFADYVLDPNLYKKGYDASGIHDEELSEEVEFSDDEKEAEYKKTRASAKRGAKSRKNIQEKNSGRAKWAENKLLGDRLQRNVNCANGLKGKARKKDCSRLGGATLRCIPLPVQSLGGHQTTWNNRIQQFPQSLGPQAGSVMQAMTSIDSGTPSQVSDWFSGAPRSWEVLYSKSSQDSTGLIHPVQPINFSGKAICGGDYKAKSFNVLQSSPLHDQAQGVHAWQPHMMPLHDLPGQIRQGQPHSLVQCDPALRTPSENLHSRAPFLEAAARVNSGGLPVLSELVLNGNHINATPMGSPQMLMHPKSLGRLAQSSGYHVNYPVTAWSDGHSTHVAGGYQLLPLDEKQGTVNMGVGMSVLQHPRLHTDMEMNMLCNMGMLSRHNVQASPMPWEEPFRQRTPSQLYQNSVLEDRSSIPFSQPSNLSGNSYGLRPPGNSSQATKHWHL